MPVINSFFADGYYKKTGTSSLTLSKDRFNYGFSGTVGIAFQHNRAISLNISNMFGNIAGPSRINFIPPNASESYSSDQFYLEMNHENLSIRTLVISPTLHFSNNSSLLPVGVSHEVGIGYRTTRIVEKEYAYNVMPYHMGYSDQNGSYTQFNLNTTAEANAFVDSLVKADGSYIDYKRKYIGATFTYALRIRKPLTESIGMNVGLKYSLNLTRIQDKDPLYFKTIQDHLLNYHRFSIITFDFGLTLMF